MKLKKFHLLLVTSLLVEIDHECGGTVVHTQLIKDAASKYLNFPDPIIMQTPPPVYNC